MSDYVDFLAEEEGQAEPPEAVQAWIVAVIDDEPTVFEATRIALEGMRFEGRPIRLVYGPSAEAGLRLLAETPDIACVLLDVVMENAGSGFELVRAIRETLDNQAVRIILRTGQPGYAPPMEVIQRYDINDYKEKSELTRIRLCTAVVCALRSYRQLVALEKNRRGLRMIIESAANLVQPLGISDFACGVVTQIAAHLGLKPDGLLCIRQARGSTEATIIGAAGRFAGAINQPIASIDDPGLIEILVRTLKAGQDLIGKEHLALFLSGGAWSGVIYLRGCSQVSPMDRELLRLYCHNVALGFENARLFEAVSAREHEFFSLAENSPENILRFDQQGRILYANSEIKKTLAAFGVGFPGRTLLEHCPDGLYPGGVAEVQQFQATLLRVMATGAKAELELRVPDAAGTQRTHSILFTAERDAEGRLAGALSFGRDITDRARLVEQLNQAQKMEAVGQLAGGIAHDFNNILTAVIGFSDIAERRLAPGDPVRPLIGKIRASADRAAQLTRSLLAFSRKQVILARPVDINGIVKNFAPLMSRLIGESIDFKLCLSSQELTVMADPGQLEQVLMNLVANARDAMPGGGRLVLSTGRVDLDAAPGRAEPDLPAGRHALLTLSDTGSGMDEATLKRIFEPFFTSKGPGKGTGLGLSMVYGIIQQHNGFIRVQSEPGRGTTFMIHLPLTTRTVEADPGQAPAPSLHGQETILFAEDDPEIRSMTCGILREHGYSVLEAVDGQDALNCFKAHAREVDLLLLDVVLPKMSGKDVQEYVNARYPGIRTLFISGYTEDILGRKWDFGADLRLVAKPISPFALLGEIRAVLDQKARG